MSLDDLALWSVTGSGADEETGLCPSHPTTPHMPSNQVIHHYQCAGILGVALSKSTMLGKDLAITNYHCRLTQEEPSQCSLKAKLNTLIVIERQCEDQRRIKGIMSSGHKTAEAQHFGLSVGKQAARQKNA